MHHSPEPLIYRAYLTPTDRDLGVQVPRSHGLGLSESHVLLPPGRVTWGLKEALLAAWGLHPPRGQQSGPSESW